MEKQYYLDFILQAIGQHSYLERKDIDKLLWNKLPDIFSDKQKKIKINHLLSELKSQQKIINTGSLKNSKWFLTDNEKS